MSVNQFLVSSSALTLASFLMGAIAHPAHALTFTFSQSGWNRGGNVVTGEATTAPAAGILSGSFSGNWNAAGQMGASDLTDFSISWSGNSFVPAFSYSGLPSLFPNAFSQFCYGVGCTTGSQPGFVFETGTPGYDGSVRFAGTLIGMTSDQQVSGRIQGAGVISVSGSNAFTATDRGAIVAQAESSTPVPEPGTIGGLVLLGIGLGLQKLRQR